MRGIRAAFLLLFVAACSSSTGSVSGDPDSISKILGFEGRQKEAAAEERVVDCMRRQGFEYRPFLARYEETVPLPESGEMAWILVHGYGMADALLRSPVGPQAPSDPNQLIRSKLPEVQVAAYDKALTGDERGGANGGPSTGCYAEGSTLGANTLETSDLNARLLDLTVRIDADPVVRAMQVNWSRCMRTFGFVVPSEREIVRTLLGPVERGILEKASEPRKGGSARVSTSSVEQLRAFELTVARADFECRTQEDYNRTAEIRRQYEASFIDENRTLLENASTP